MARQVDSAVLIVSALAAFFATFFAVLLLLQPERPAPTPETVASHVDPLPPVAAAPPATESPTAAPPVDTAPPPPVTRSPEPALKLLDQLGVKCAEGAHCAPAD